MSSKRPFFPLFFKDRDKLKYLSAEQRGELLTALFDYAADGNVPALDGLVGFAFEVFREGIDTSLERYEETCEKRRKAGKKGGRPKKQVVFEEKQKKQMVFEGNQKKANESKKTEERRERSEDRSQKIEDRSQKSEAEQCSQGAHTDADSDADMAIRNYFADKVGREPSQEFIRSAEQTGLSVGYICAAIAKSTGANVPEGYATNILRRWASDGVPSNVHPVTAPNAPMEPWEQDWLAEYKAMTKEDEHDNNGSYRTAENADGQSGEKPGSFGEF